jgi:uncharacterized protein (DUF433 family)
MADVIQMAFTAEQVRGVTGLSKRQLTYWVETAFFTPQLAGEDDALRLFTFRDLVGLRTIAILRHEHQVPLQELRKVGAWLRQYHETPWSSLRLYIANKRIYFDDPGTGTRLQARAPEQGHLPAVELQRIADDTSALVVAMRKRRAQQYGRIEKKRDVARNAARLSGTRIPTAAIWSFHEAGYSARQILAEYPSLTEADVETAIDHERREHRKRARKRAG